MKRNFRSTDDKSRRERIKKALLWLSAILAGAGASAVAAKHLRRHPAGLAFEDLIKTNPDLKVGICGATSTPLWLMEQVSERLSAS